MCTIHFKGKHGLVSGKFNVGLMEKQDKVRVKCVSLLPQGELLL